jgi:hypothetical protein
LSTPQHNRFSFVMSSEVETSRSTTLDTATGSFDYASLAQDDANEHNKKTGRKMNSPPGLKLGVVTPKNFGAVDPALGLVPLFLR